ncbi:1,4-alpha-glucan branching protein GlgB [[Mycoplasma] testudinis]|uniref:1,4-alpha-glucan branching protein GlgB n=1 Tax=[Mycoplasma] testudinis TaxID=33924 RepID=UPI0006981EA8|nr:1,4-alpha-glucan branching protein GlgB [[Mycoplasma] testudinis]
MLPKKIALKADLLTTAHQKEKSMKVSVSAAKTNSLRHVSKMIDLLKFTEGTHTHLHDELGALQVSNNIVDGFVFRVWAPHAKAVNLMIVAKDQMVAHAMKKTMHGIWEVQINKINYGCKYKYQIITADDKVLMKSDPFAFYAELDPYFNSILYNRSAYQWKDQKYLKRRAVEKYENLPMAIYEVHLGSWRKTLDNKFLNYEDYAHQLIEYVKNMGYTHIEFLPLAEHPFLGSWGYQITGYFAATSRYGNPDELKYLIDLAHQNNIKVIMDFVPVHFNKDDHGLYNFDGTHEVFSSPIEFDRENYLWGTANFNLGKNEVKSFLLSALYYWIEDFHIDGFRFDAVSYILYYQGNSSGKVNPDGVEFIKNTISHVKENHPDVLMIAEDSSAYGSVTKSLSTGGLGFDLKWDLGFSNDFFRFMKKPFEARRDGGAFNDITFSISYNFTERFLVAFSHDEVVHLKKSILLKSPGFYDQQMRQSKLMIGYLFGHPGKKLLFMGIDFAQANEWNEKTSLDWHLLSNHFNQTHSLFAKDLLHLYKEQKPLYEREFDPLAFEWVLVHENNNIFAFNRKGLKAHDELLMVYNFSDQYYETYTIDLKAKPDHKHLFEYVELLNSDDLKYGGTGAINTMDENPGKIVIQQDENHCWVNIKLAPFAAIFLKKNKI